MCKDVEEEPSVVREPGPGAGEEIGPVPHVLEHLDGDDPIERRSRRRSRRPVRGKVLCGVEIVHVRREDADVREATVLGP